MSHKLANNQNEPKTFELVPVGSTHAGFDVAIPIHRIVGKQEGPTLLVQAGLSGLEVEPAVILPKLVQEINPETLSGILILVPLLNVSGFEFEQVNFMWDNKNLHELGRGNPAGSLSERLIHTYYHNYVSKADMVLEIRTGAQWSYNHYVHTYEGAPEKAINAALQVGLPHVLTHVPYDNSMLSEATKDCIPAITAWIGGGPGLRDYREDDGQYLRHAVFNTLKALAMLPGAPDYNVEEVSVFKHLYSVNNLDKRGLVFMDQGRRGEEVQVNQEIGYVRHPYTGETLDRITSPVHGVMLDAGASWPVLPEDTTLAIIGELSKTHKIIEGELC